jgi:hypothetical protein
MARDESTWGRLANIPVLIDGYGFQRLVQDVSSGFQRVTTVVRLFGDGEEGIGEDVGYLTADHDALQVWGKRLPLSGKHTLGSLSAALDEIELFPTPSELPASVNYRRWAFESAALDLALRQQNVALHDALGRTPQPVRFVVSRRLAEPPSAAELEALLESDPDLRFKLDPTSAWDDAACAAIAALGVVEVVDLKGAYKGTSVDQAPDPALYARVLAAFGDAYVEDPALTDATQPLLEPHAERVTWDAVIHSAADIDGLPWRPRALNSKPSRFGPLRELLGFYDRCARDGIALYGGGQFELGPGRGQIQYLASLFHPETGNDVAPGGYNAVELAPGLARSPLAPHPAETGFRWGPGAG